MSNDEPPSSSFLIATHHTLSGGASWHYLYISTHNCAFGGRFASLFFLRSTDSRSRCMLICAEVDVASICSIDFNFICGPARRRSAEVRESQQVPNSRPRGTLVCVEFPWPQVRLQTLIYAARVLLFLLLNFFSQYTLITKTLHTALLSGALDEDSQKKRDSPRELVPRENFRKIVSRYTNQLCLVLPLGRIWVTCLSRSPHLNYASSPLQVTIATRVTSRLILNPSLYDREIATQFVDWNVPSILRHSWDILMPATD